MTLALFFSVVLLMLSGPVDQTLPPMLGPLLIETFEATMLPPTMVPPETVTLPETQTLPLMTQPLLIARSPLLTTRSAAAAAPPSQVTLPVRTMTAAPEPSGSTSVPEP